jgi:hypothetical protein
MALVVADRVKETTTSTGTGAITLAGAQPNFVAFSAVLSDGDTTFYAIVDNNNLAWEVGVGTYASAGNTVTRTTVLASSNAGSAVNLQAGTKEVFVTNPATQAVYLDANDKIAGNQTFSGTVTLNADPASGLQAATKQYVDTIAAAGLHYHDPVRVEKEGNLVVTYDNGTAGVGATLTNADTQAALVIDGVTLSVADRVLIYEQTDATQNGIYTVTDTGSVSTNWVLTRATDADTYAPSDPDSLGQGDAFFVQEGTLGAGETYVMNTEGTITFGTTNITFAQVSFAQVYTGGTGINITGSVISTDATLAEITVNGATTADAVTVGGLHVNSTDAVEMPTGTEAQRPSAVTGMFRFNTDSSSFEGYNGTAWGAVGGGASGGGEDAVFYENDQVVTTDYTIAADKNAMSTGPISINSGVSVTIETGARWVVI